MPSSSLIRLYHIVRGHIHKNSHLLFYIKGIWRDTWPHVFCRMALRRKLRTLERMTPEERAYIMRRVNHYCHLEPPIQLADNAYPLSRFTMKKKDREVTGVVHSAHYFDCQEYTRFFPKNLKWSMFSGDVNYTFPQPTICKSRPILVAEIPNNNILLNMNKVRHFLWIKDPFRWEEKDARILFRGDAHMKPHR